MRLSVGDDDGSQGTINGSEVITGTTDGNGQVIASFTKGASAAGTVVVRAEALVGEDAALRVTHEDSEVLTLSAGSPPGNNSIYLPLISNNTGQAE